MRDVKNLLATGCDAVYIEKWTKELGLSKLAGSTTMNDTTPEIAERVRAELMALSNATRFVMGAKMFEAARQMIIASLPKDLSAPELKRRLYERIYGKALPF